MLSITIPKQVPASPSTSFDIYKKDSVRRRVDRMIRELKVPANKLCADDRKITDRREEKGKAELNRTELKKKEKEGKKNTINKPPRACIAKYLRFPL